MKPLIGYYGGKQRIASKIIPHLQAIPHSVRAIPFAGGLGVFYNWDKPKVSSKRGYIEAINDIDSELINLYRTARENPEEFQRWIEFTPHSQADYQKAKEIWRKPEGYSELERAWAYYVHIQMAFSNNLNSGWGVSVVSNAASVWENKKSRIPQCLERLKDVSIGCEDALDFIKRWDSPQTLFYLDPPYVGTNMGHYDFYTADDFQKLCDLLDSIQGSYALSTDTKSYGFLKLKPKSVQLEVQINARCSASGVGVTGWNRDKSRKATEEDMGNRQRVELLWVCDRSENIRPDIKETIAKREAYNAQAQ